MNLRQVNNLSRVLALDSGSPGLKPQSSQLMIDFSAHFLWPSHLSGAMGIDDLFFFRVFCPTALH